MCTNQEPTKNPRNVIKHHAVFHQSQPKSCSKSSTQMNPTKKVMKIMMNPTIHSDYSNDLPWKSENYIIQIDPIKNHN